MKKIFKIISISIISLLGLILLFGLFIQTGFFKNILRDRIIASVNSNQNGELAIEKIRGDFFSKITIENLSLKNNGNTILLVPQFQLKFSLIPLLQKKVKINLLQIDSVYLNVKQNKEGIWNFAELLPKSSEKTREKKDFQWEIFLKSGSLRISQIDLQTQISKINFPHKIKDIGILFSGAFSQNKLACILKNLSFQTTEPDFGLERLSIKLSKINDDIKFENLIFQTNQNHIFGDLNYKDSIIESAKIISQNFDLKEFQAFVPALKGANLPIFDLAATIQKNNLATKLAINEPDQSLDLQARIRSIFSDPKYQIEFDTQNLNLGYWLGNDDLISSINGQLTITGKGTGIDNLDADLKLELTDTDLMKYELEKLVFKGSIHQGSLKLNGDLKGNFGSFLLKGQVSDILENPVYTFSGKTQRLNLEPILFSDQYQSDLNSTFSIKGEGKDADSLSADVRFLMKESTFNNIPFDSLEVIARYNAQNYNISKMRLVSPIAKLNLSGRGNFKQANEINYFFDLQDLTTIGNYFKIDSLAGSGKLSGKIMGALDSLHLNNQIEFSKTKYRKNSFQNLSLTSHFLKTDANFSGGLNLIVDSISANSFLIDRFSTTTTFGQNEYLTNIRAVSDSLEFVLRSDVKVGDSIIVKIPELTIRKGDIVWKTGDTSANLIINENEYQVENFILKSDSQFISLDGVIDLEDELDINLSLKEIKLDELNDLYQFPFQVGGKLNLNAEVKSNVNEPEISASLNISKPTFDAFGLNAFEFQTSYQDSILHSTFRIEPTEFDTMKVSAEIPISFPRSDSSGFLKPEKPVSFAMKSDSLDLKIVNDFSDLIKDMSGYLTVDLQVKNTINNPELFGSLIYTDGKIRIPKYDINYPNINCRIHTQKDTIFLDDLSVRKSGGNLAVSGKMGLKEKIENGYKDFNFQINAEDFQAAKGEKISLLLDSDIILQGSPTEMFFDGNLTLIESAIDLDVFQSSASKSSQFDKPLLVQTLEDTIKTVNPSEKQITEPQFGTKLTGNLKVNIPNNFWIKNKDMNIELKGEIEIAKTSDNFGIFGSIETVRGFYKLFGKTFNFTDGTIVFAGGKKIDPNLDLEVSHPFRDIDGKRRSLSIHVSGQALSPQISFFLDDKQILEQEAISYLIFGKNTSELSSGEKSQVSEQAGDFNFATNFISHKLMGEITKEIGDYLDLDEIEFDGGQTWKQATFRAGKYLTDKIYVSYQQDFDFSNNQEIVPEKIILNYEINEHFHLIVTKGSDEETGFDLFWIFIK